MVQQLLRGARDSLKSRQGTIETVYSQRNPHGCLLWPGGMQKLFQMRTNFESRGVCKRSCCWRNLSGMSQF